jgi:hypothetical protein
MLGQDPKKKILRVILNYSAASAGISESLLPINRKILANRAKP